MSQALRFGLFFVVLLLVVGGLNLFVHRRVSAAFELERAGRRRLAFVLLAAIVTTALGRAVGVGLARLAAGVGSVVELAVLVSAVLFALERLVVKLASLVARRHLPQPAVARGSAVEVEAGPPTSVGGASSPAAAAAPGEGAPPVRVAGSGAACEVEGPVAEPPGAIWTRRAVLARASASAVVAIGGGSAGYGWLRGRHDYVVEEVPIRLAKLPRALDGFTIAQLSDVHLGLFGGELEMATAVELVGRARPDLVAITGDMIDHDPAYADALGRLVRRLGELAPVVVVPGNHDHYAGVDVVLDRVRRGGGEALVNRHVRVGGGALVVAGVDDLWARRLRSGRGPDLAAALAGAPDDLPRVLLAHQPVFFADAASKVDLQLSGHTHGGQFTLGVPFAERVLPHGWVAGRYERGGAQLYVNRGFGTAGPPARLGAPPEVTRLVLTV